MAYYKVVSKSKDLPPSQVTAVGRWDFVVVRTIDNYPLCLCESGEAAHYMETLLNDRPLGHARLV